VKEKDKNFRSDIAGLRALAVMLVILSHFQIYGFHFGFIGVDIFFVISGFLITRILYKEFVLSDRDPTKTFLSLTAFYLRRIRRLVPAAVVVIALVNVISFFLYNAQSRQDLLNNSKWALLFLANVSFLRSESDYFQQNNEPSMLQHYWSLSVEEQFYFIWPILFLIAASMHKIKVRNKYFRFNKRILTLIAFISVLSFLFLQYGFKIAPTEAYFSIFTRAWELGIGSFCGILAFHKSREKFYSRIERYLPFIAALLFSAFFLGDDNWAKFIAIPVLATGFLLYAGQDQATSQNEKHRLFGFIARLTLFIGSISYSLYLVHWPIYILANRLEVTGNLISHILLIPLSVLFGFLLWKYVEIPFQRIALPKRPTWEPRLFLFMKNRKPLIAFLSIFLVGSLFLITYPDTTGRVIASDSNLKNLASDPAIKMYSNYQEKLISGSSESVEETFKVTDTSTVDVSTKIAALFNQTLKGLSEGIKLSKLSEASIKEITTMGADASQFELSVCPRNESVIPIDCTVGNRSAGAKKVALIGDSKMGALAQPIIDYFVSRDWLVVPMVMEGCVMSQPLNNSKINCSARADWVLANVASANYDVVISAEFPSTRDLPTRESYLKKIEASTSKLIIIHSNSRTKSPKDCLSRDYTYSIECQTVPAEMQFGWTQSIRADRALRSLKTHIVEAHQWMCIDFICPIVAQGIFVTRDGSHLTYTYAKRISPLIELTLDTILKL
jgi:peptidoglycan/LPS O-acetylase OafA/YrhL